MLRYLIQDHLRFESPWLLLLLAAVVIVLKLVELAVRRPAIRFSSLETLRRLPLNARNRVAGFPRLARVLALAFIVLAFARPQEGRERVSRSTQGVAIMMVLDQSGSMGAEMPYRHRALTRMEVVKRVFTDFMLGRKDTTLKGRPNDLVGLIAFARDPCTICPLTFNHETLAELADKLDMAEGRAGNRTAVGDALALAAARLKTAEDYLKKWRQSQGAPTDVYEIKSKIIILLTDGRSNFGDRSPIEAAELAKKWGIKVYTIGVGSTDEPTVFSMMAGDQGVDQETLRKIAKMTGGIYRLATNEQSLRDIYAEINRLERTDIRSETFTDYAERFEPFALIALCLLAFEALLSSTVLRRLP